MSWRKQYHGTATSGTDRSELRNYDNFGLCASAKWLQYHDSVCVVQGSETEDPQLVAEPVVGRNHGQAMGKG